METEELVRRCKDGDRGALALLYQTYSGRLFRLCADIVKDRDAAQDLLHDGFIIIFSSIGSLRSPARLEAWMSRVMANLAVKYLNDRKNRPVAGTVADVPVEAEEGQGGCDIPFDELMRIQNFVLQLLADLAKYDLDGIILDRCRYDDYGLESDFSDISKQKFEEYIGETVANFPADIMAPGTDEIPSDQPVYFKKWLEFRAKVIHDFIVKAREKVKSVNNNIKFGVYVGAWYSTYYTSGVNWASPKYNTSAYYPKWATSDYKNYGYADHLDYIFLGAYASVNNIYGSGEWTMEGFCKNGRELLQGDVPFAGGPDIGNSTGWTDGGQSAKIPDAIDACINNSDGFFAFDLCHVKKYDYWNAFKTGFDKYLKSIEE